jgi:hypothetical protein
MVQFIVVAIIKLILEIILRKVSPDVRKAIRTGMDTVTAADGNKVDEAVIEKLGPPEVGSGINSPIDSP